MTSTSTTRLRRDAGASIFAFGLAGVALLVHATTSVLDDWVGGRIALHVTGTGATGATTLHVDAADVPGWSVLALRMAELVQWLAGAAVLVMLSVCVVRMIGGEVFSRPTARWAAGAGWATLVLLLVPTILRAVATNVAIHGALDASRWDPATVATQWWYLYVGMMALSFLALVLRRGSQLQADQDGLI